jgi:hypothetical protein
MGTASPPGSALEKQIDGRLKPTGRSPRPERLFRPRYVPNSCSPENHPSLQQSNCSEQRATPQRKHEKNCK